MMVKPEGPDRVESGDLRSFLVLAMLLLPSLSVPADGRDALAEIAASRVESVDVTIDRWRDERAAVSVSTSEVAPVEKLAAAVRGGKPIEDHACWDIGTIEFHLKSGGVVTFGMLPGHDTAAYQLRHYPGSTEGSAYAVFEVDRQALFDALARIGVPVTDSAFPL